jgi:diguanylate cyclase (GGDEF)-like protein
MKILLAEDSKTMMLATTAIIHQSGNEVIQARDGKEALSLYHSEDPDLILLDVEMPELNGFQVAEKIRYEDRDKWIPIIFLTSHKDDEHLSQGINAGGDDYLIKPVSQVVLNSKLKAMYRIFEMQNKLFSITKELSKANDKLQKSVITDPLTGSKNRLYLDESIKREWHRGMRYKKELSLLILDIDNFKIINDSNGHQAGDKCLIELVEIINSYLKRSTDVLCRYGCDEFVILLPDTSSIDAEHIAELIRQNIDKSNVKPTKGTKVPVRITVSIGSASCIPDESISYSEFLSYADKALYAAKDAGRNCVVTSEISENKNVAA